MKKVSMILSAVCLLLLFSCKSKNSATISENKKIDNRGALYFDYSIDGKEMHIDAEDISASYYVTDNKKVFKIFAGKDGSPKILLTIPHDMSQPSSTPNGSKDYEQEITQGSISLQDYPEKGYTTNSFNTIYDEMSVIVPDAVVIVSTEKEGNVARIISGTFNAITYGEKDGKDSKDGNHKVAGKFKIRHEFSSTNGGEF